MEGVVTRMQLFNDVYKGKRVLVTGHTGFKGSWLSLWLCELGAEVAGFSKYLPSDPCHFSAAQLSNKLDHHIGDIRDITALEKLCKDFKPQVVFHLAAQPIVRESYNSPKLTFDTNLGGTVNVLECIKNSDDVEAAVIITSDKCYENVGWDWGYRETDRLGGEDPYSASKACAEIAFNAYFRSFFGQKDSPKIATTRAGNVIGGGDWAQDRIIPDCVKAWSRNEVPIIRKPQATRPWQHVLEPLSGYLWLGAFLMNKTPRITGEAFNFGPNADVVKSVKELADLFLKYWGQGMWKHVPLDDDKKEATLLKLSNDKVLKRLSWRPVLSFEETVDLTASWYKKFYQEKIECYEFACSQIDYYVQKALEKKLPWVDKGFNDARRGQDTVAGNIS